MDEKIKKILLIDDDRMALDIVTSYLRRSNRFDNIITFQSARDALHYLKSSAGNWPDVILCDLEMPDMTGWEFLDNYFERGYDLRPCLICVHTCESGSFDFDDLEKRNHVHMYIPKPMDKEKVDQIYRYLQWQRKVDFQRKMPMKYVIS